MYNWIPACIEFVSCLDVNKAGAAYILIDKLYDSCKFGKANSFTPEPCIKIELHAA